MTLLSGKGSSVNKPTPARLAEDAQVEGVAVIMESFDGAEVQLEYAERVALALLRTVRLARHEHKQTRRNVAEFTGFRIIAGNLPPAA